MRKRGHYFSLPIAAAFVALSNCGEGSSRETVGALEQPQEVGGAGGDGAAGAASSDGSFEEVAQSVGLVGTHASWGLSWADYDGDGYLDVITYAHLPEISCSKTQLWRNDGQGSFQDVTIAAGFASDGGDDTADEAGPNGMFNCDLSSESEEQIDAYDQGDTHGTVWMDFNRDGCKDLYLVNGSLKAAEIHYDRLWRNNCDGTFTNVAELVPCESDDDCEGGVCKGKNSGEAACSGGLVGTYHRARAVMAFDHDVDGWVDLFSTGFNRQSTDYSNRLLHNNGDESFSDLAQAVGIARDDDANRSAAWADYDDDGQIDLIIAGTPPCDPVEHPNCGEEPTTGSLGVLYHNEGDGSFTDATDDAGLVKDLEWASFAWGDYDADGDVDLYLTRGVDLPGDDSLYQNQGDGTFVDVTVDAGIANPGPARGATFGDYDNDGDLDLYVVNLGHTTPASANRLYSNDGDGTFTDVRDAEGVTMSGFEGAGACVTFVDYDRDGQLDISVTDGEGNAMGPYVLFHNKGHAGHWLEIQLEGTASERDGLGAKIALTTELGTQYRVQSGPHHFLSQSSTPVHFGLGDAGAVSEIVVSWPSGSEQVLEGVEVDQVLTIVEPGEPAEPNPVGSGGANGNGAGGDGAGGDGAGGDGASGEGPGGPSGARRRAVSDDSACGCRTPRGSTERGWPALVAALGLLAWRRRRRLA
jgi:MYXO-CTERM domain-containing protein